MYRENFDYISKLKMFHDSITRNQRADIIEPQTFFYRFGPDNAALFDCVCVYLNFATSGEGGTKKEAEQDAKESMLEYAVEADILQHFGDRTTHQPPHILKLRQRLDACSVGLPGDAAAPAAADAVAKALAEAFMFKTITSIIFDELPFVCTPKDATDLRTRILPNAWTLVDRIKLGRLLVGRRCDLTFVRELLLWEVHHEVFRQRVAESSAFEAKQGYTACKSRTRTTLIHNFIADPRLAGATYTDHDRSPDSGLFRCVCDVRGIEAIGEGRRKKVAKQDAARAMLLKLEGNTSIAARTVGRHEIDGGKHSKFKIFRPSETFEIASKIGWTATLNPDCEHLIAAFTHSSASGLNNYEYLEHLGDALLKHIVVAVVLRHVDPSRLTGTFSNKIDEIICRDAALRVAKALDLERHIFVYNKGSVVVDSMLADVVEALIAALWLSENGTTTTSTEHEWAVAYTVARWFKDDIARAFGPLVAAFPSPPPFGLYFLQLEGHLVPADPEQLREIPSSLRDMIELWLETGIIGTWHVLKHDTCFMTACIATAPLAITRALKLTLWEALSDPPSLALTVRTWQMKPTNPRRVTAPNFTRAFPSSREIPRARLPSHQSIIF